MRTSARLTSSSSVSKFIPCSRARCELAWITGPSAMGSENGSPNSITSAPASRNACISSTVRSASGCPAVMYGTSARFPAALSAANRFAIASDEIVADPDAISVRIVGLDDGAEEDAVGVAIGQVDERSGMLEIAVVVRNDTHDGSREHLLQRIRRVHHPELERIEDDER